MSLGRVEGAQACMLPSSSYAHWVAGCSGGHMDVDPTHILLQKKARSIPGFWSQAPHKGWNVPLPALETAPAPHPLPCPAQPRQAARRGQSNAAASLHRRPSLTGSWCTMVDVLRKLSISKPPVSLDMYKSSYMMDYRPYNDGKPSIENHSQKIKLGEAQLKAKEFARPSKYQSAVMYKEDSVSQRRETAQGPCIQAAISTDKLEKGHTGGSFGPESFQEVREDQRKYFNTVLPNAECYLSKCYPITEQMATQEDKMEKTQIPTMPEREASYPSPSYPQPPATPEQCPEKEGQEGPVFYKRRQGQTWDTYPQFILETCRARQTKAQQNKSMVLGSCVFGEDGFNSDGASTYSTDYKRWPGVRNGHCKAQRNFSNIFFEDGHCNHSGSPPRCQL
ncbi:protein SPMIP9 isoform X2 [Emydura macquarii macquarii]|uniref:protein SPMIP9 isoform X2 n=1 Tax=Emydura macquarii macquarii TaxID=1129001 RepID=UPI00352A317F